MADPLTNRQYALVADGPNRRRARAEGRQDAGYRAALASAPTVGDDEWVSQFDAGQALHISLSRVGFLIQGRRLRPAHNAAGQAGVTRASVDAERPRREGARIGRRAWLFIADVAGSLVRGI